MDHQPAAEILASLQYEEVLPEHLLLQLDERPKPLPIDIVNMLPKVAPLPDQECCICHVKGEMSFPDALELPCGDAPFCPPCGRTWLFTYGSQCPLCQQPADPCAFADKKQKKSVCGEEAEEEPSDLLHPTRVEAMNAPMHG
eukprot:1343776-Karenia_brevis.AAC.1